ncbi:hypothetical protein FSP39_020652 [Pinctada imbricata]|uniref:Neurotransmitter-gated ion-channel transmembrane domain-containing protein n=1 Tax=Pinctada imbricata TaxID=66713 RepID=A0AA89BKW8_PINIB|nr:hypothetical protein FSP39_020652 [Pinctada imbricata]
MDFKKDFRDSSGKNTAVSDSKVELKNGNAIFNTYSTISIWRFAGTYIGNNLMIKLLFKPEKSPIIRQTLVGNCAKGRSMSYGIEIDRVEEVAIFTVDTTPRSPVSLKVPIQLNDWNDVTLIYDGLDLTGLNYEKRRSKPLAVFGVMLPAVTDDKMTLQVTILLTIIVFLLLVQDKLPSSSDTFPYLGIFFVVAMFLTSLSCVMSGITIYLYHGGLSEKLSGCTKTICLQYIAKCLCIKLRENKECDEFIEETENAHVEMHSESNNDLVMDPGQM